MNREQRKRGDGELLTELGGKFIWALVGRVEFLFHVVMI